MVEEISGEKERGGEEEKTKMRENDRTGERRGDFGRDEESERDRKMEKKLGRGRDQIPKR